MNKQKYLCNKVDIHEEQLVVRLLLKYPSNKSIIRITGINHISHERSIKRRPMKCARQKREFTKNALRTSRFSPHVVIYCQYVRIVII